MRTVLCRHGEIALDCDVCGKDARIEHLEAENKRLRQALEVYADESSWFSTYDNKNEVLFMHDCGDGYKIAQEALNGE